MMSISGMDKSRTDPSIRLSNFSLKRSNQSPGFERITSIGGREEPAYLEPRGTGHVPRGSISVTKDIRIEQQDV